MTDKSYMTTKTPEERWAYVEAQLKAGNPKYKPKGQWIADNKEMIGINALNKMRRYYGEQQIPKVK